MKKATLALTALLILTLSGSALAETVPYGLIQTWYTYTSFDEEAANLEVEETETFTQTGFAMKRARIGVLHKWEEFTGFFFYDAVPERFVDAWILYQVNDQFSVQGGRFRGVGLQASGLTSPVKLDLVDYPVIAKKWAASTHGAFSRSLGVQLNAKFNEMFKASLFLHNGRDDGDDFKVTNTPYAEIVSTRADSLVKPVKTGFLPKVDLGFYATPTEGVDLGFTYGIPNEYRPQAGGTFVGSMTAFAYYQTERYRVKVDFLRLDDKGIDFDGDEDDTTAQGYALTAAYGINDQLEVAGRYENYDPNTDVDDDALANVTVGLNYSFNPDAPYNHRLQANYIRRLDETMTDVDIPDPNVFQLQWQVFIH